jgi:hypothetical protein
MTKTRILWVTLGLFGLALVLLCLPISNKLPQKKMTTLPVNRLDLSAFSSRPLPRPLDALFIHHSCGGQLLASLGDSVGAQCIFQSHPNGGNLRTLLEQNGYRVHEASYGSRLGEHTDVFDWLPKFRNHMDDVLTCDQQDTPLRHGERNEVVMFKSCFPNNAFTHEGAAPGDSRGPELTVWNARAAYTALRDEFRKQPRVLFVCLTAPPMAPGPKSQPLWRKLGREAKALLRGQSRIDLSESARLARQFNNWLADTNGWLKDYPLNNVVVFDYYDILTGHGKSDLSMYATWDGADSHPDRQGNEMAAQALVPFLNQAARRAGVLEMDGKALSSR